jgi:hypothetical protein
MKLKCVLRIANMSGGRYRQNGNTKKKENKRKSRKDKNLEWFHTDLLEILDRKLGNTERKTKH